MTLKHRRVVARQSPVGFTVAFNGPTAWNKGPQALLVGDS